MTCEEFEQILLDFRYHTNSDGWILRVSKSALIEAHIANCPACATKMMETTKLEDALDQLRVATEHFQTSPEVEKNLLEAFRRETSERRRSFHMMFGRRLAWLPTAALALIVGGVFLYARLRPSSLVTDQGNGTGHRVRILTPFPPRFSVSGTEAFDNQPRAENDSRRAVHRAAKLRKSILESSARRIAIPEEDLSMNGGGSVVRVTLPLSSLLAMGVPVHPEASDPRVMADVTLDPFGAVVGVRLVDEQSKAN
jgi:hypothetical protein